MWIEKSIPTPTRIDPTITVTRESGTPRESIASHCIATVKPTGTVVNRAKRRSLNTRPNARMVARRANPREVHCESTIRLLTAIVTEATPTRSEALTPSVTSTQ